MNLEISADVPRKISAFLCLLIRCHGHGNSGDWNRVKSLVYVWRFFMFHYKEIFDIRSRVSSSGLKIQLMLFEFHRESHPCQIWRHYKYLFWEFSFGLVEGIGN